ncbi:thiamine-phosphate kinase [Cellulomonas edaphi]|uniref:Thiamine-monophosphate kinase n=1 Tax=Cellulomonas edaphi TaxID=3053468 RepID=A0ABT7S7V6_9CELL|nr:thiamine-phosphate kinase [Cellulomons edaphi]MDM7831702.1 thiamine-phosphate kinase [Cellulomons edaphi]
MNSPSSPADGPLVGELDEDALLARILPQLPRGAATLVPPGDDAAVVAAPDGRFVVTTDVLVEDHHFRRRWSDGSDVGQRAAVQNLADVAAMGAHPTSLVVSLVVPGDLPAQWVEDLARGFAAVCGPLDVGVVGGDLSGGPVVVVSVTAHGDLEGRDPVLRSGARAGDVVAHAGVRGRSAAGWALLEAGRGAAHPGLVDAYLRPSSPLASGVAAARAGASAMLDVSDGLLRDAGRIARASGVALDLEGPSAFAADLAALEPAARELAADAGDWVMTGGEDHGLLATFPASATLPVGFAAVGRVVSGAPGVLVQGEPWSGTGGWDHFER